MKMNFNSASLADFCVKQLGYASEVSIRAMESSKSLNCSPCSKRLRRERLRRLHEFRKMVLELLKFVQVSRKARSLRVQYAPIVLPAPLKLIERIQAARCELERLEQACDWRRQPRPKRRKTYQLGLLIRCGTPEERRHAGFRLLQRERGLRSAEAARKRGYWNFDNATSDCNPSALRPKVGQDLPL
jgi:hypothetical protein